MVQNQIGLYPDDGLGSVYHAMMVNGATYQYLYDAHGRRRLKVYPSGLTDEFFYSGGQMIEDRGLQTPLRGDKNVVDQYIYLLGAQVAVVREALDSDYQPTGDSVCDRNDEPASCGTFFIVNDALPKPVALLDSNGRVAGVGEYDPFGRVNTVTIRSDSPHESTDLSVRPLGHYLPNQNAVVLASFAQPARTASQRVRARVNYAQINTAYSTDKTWVENAVTGQALTPYYSGVMKAYQTSWIPLEYPQGVVVRWSANGTMPKRYGGATTATYEYQRYEVGAEPAWIPSRFPGQYADAETGLFENWNRFYDPATGRYSASDALLRRAQVEALQGVYEYAMNRPLAMIDATGDMAQADANPDAEFRNEARCGNGEAAFCYEWGKGDFISSFLSEIDSLAIEADRKIAASRVNPEWEYSSSIVDVPGRGLVASVPRTDGSADEVAILQPPGFVASVHTHGEQPPVPSPHDLTGMKAGPAYIVSETPSSLEQDGRAIMVRWTLSGGRFGGIMQPSVSSWVPPGAEGRQAVNAFSLASFKVIYIKHWAHEGL